MPVHTEIVNRFQLKSYVEGPGSMFAFHLLEGNRVVQKLRYRHQREHTFGLTKAGTYRVKVFRRLGSGHVETEFGAPIRFRGFLDSPPLPAQKPIAIAGISRLSAFAGLVFSKGNDVRCYVDPSGEHVGSQFFGLPVVASPPADARIIGPEGYRATLPSLEGVSLRSGEVNALSQEFHRYGAVELYRVGREAYLGGMDRGAHAIEMFILTKYSTRLPATAVIGEGTALGVGGMGIAIHPDSVVGRDCVIAQNVTLGSRQGGNGTPIIGDNVYIGPGANCLGGRIGNNVVVGAGAVVLNEVPDNTVVAGVPARVISRDVERLRALTHRRAVKHS